MPNFQISDLPLATLPLDSANSFFEVQTVEGGVPVSRKIAETNIMADLPDGTTVGSIIRLSVAPDLYVNSEQIIADGTSVEFRHVTTPVARTLTTGAGGLEVDNQFSGGGFERVLTQSDLLIALDDLTDVTLTAPATGAVLYKSAGNWLDTPGILIDPAADVKLHQATVEVARTLTAAAGGFEANNTLTGAGFERVLTVSDIATAVFESRTLDVNGTANEIDVTPAGPLDLSADRAWVVGIADDAIFPGNGAIEVPTGTTGEEPASENGRIRYDNSTSKMRVVEDEAWIDMITDTLAELTDVTLTAPATGSVLYKSVGNWLDTNAVDIDPVAAVQLRHNGTPMARTALIGAGGLEVNNTVTGAGFERVLTTADLTGAIALNDLSDVVIATPLASQTLRFNGSNWVNASQILQTGDGLTMGGITTGITGVNVRGRFTNAGESGGSTQTTVSWLDDDGSVSFGEIEWRTTGGGTDGDTMYFRNRRHGGTIEFEGENDAGTLVPMSGFDPQTVINTLHTDIVVDGAAARIIELFPTGGERFQFESAETGTTLFTMGFSTQPSILSSSEVGAVILGNIFGGTGEVTIGGGNNDRINFLTDNTRSMQFALTNTVDWDITNQENGGEIAIRATQGGGTIVDMVLCDPDGPVSISNADEVQIRTQQADAAGFTTGARIRGHDDLFRDIGWNTLPIIEVPASRTLSEVDVGMLLHRDGGLAGTITLPSGTSGAIPLVGAWIQFACETATSVTITAAGTLRFFDGSGTPATGNRTITEGGIANLFHFSDTEWWIWGFGIT